MKRFFVALTHLLFLPHHLVGDNFCDSSVFLFCEEEPFRQQSRSSLALLGLPALFPSCPSLCWTLRDGCCTHPAFWHSSTWTLPWPAAIKPGVLRHSALPVVEFSLYRQRRHCCGCGTEIDGQTDIPTQYLPLLQALSSGISLMFLWVINRWWLHLSFSLSVWF